MPCPSLTTRDLEIARNSHWPGFGVAAPGRWRSIDFVTAPRNPRPAEGRWSRQAPHPKDDAWAGIRTNGTPNGWYWSFPAGSQS